nr:TIGR02611 family protein [Gordonia humi]
MRLRIKIWHRRRRYAIRQNPHLDRTYRAAVGVVGGLMMLGGLAMIPLPIPGPGWVMLFLGLAVLSTEFAWAHRVTSFLRRQLRRANAWRARTTERVVRAWRARFGRPRDSVAVEGVDERRDQRDPPRDESDRGRDESQYEQPGDDPRDDVPAARRADE